MKRQHHSEISLVQHASLARTIKRFLSPVPETVDYLSSLPKHNEAHHTRNLPGTSQALG